MPAPDPSRGGQVRASDVPAPTRAQLFCWQISLADLEARRTAVPLELLSEVAGLPKSCPPVSDPHPVGWATWSDHGISDTLRQVGRGRSIGETLRLLRDENLLDLLAIRREFGSARPRIVRFEQITDNVGGGL